MNEQQAIEEIVKETCSACYGSDSDEEWRCNICGYKKAIEALEKQIPKKVTKVKCIHDDYNTCLDCEIILNCVLENKCPACGERLDYDYGEKNNYCPECGQRMDWIVEE